MSVLDVYPFGAKADKSQRASSLLSLPVEGVQDGVSQIPKLLNGVDPRLTCIKPCVNVIDTFCASPKSQVSGFVGAELW